MNKTRFYIITVLLVTLAFNLFPNYAASQMKMHMFAHRGAWSTNSEGDFIIPENSLAAIFQAALSGYEGIECDVKYTKDGKMVIMHDRTINRTMRNAADYSTIEEPVKVEDLTFDQLRNNYVLASTIPSLRTAVPTLKELLNECKKHNIVPMLHSKIIESYRVAQDIMGDNWVCFDSRFESVIQAREFSNCTILWSISRNFIEQTTGESGSNQKSKVLAGAVIAKLKEIGGVCGVSSMVYDAYTPEFIKELSNLGYHIQASIFPALPEAEACKNGITYLLTDRIRPTK